MVEMQTSLYCIPLLNQLLYRFGASCKWMYSQTKNTKKKVNSNASTRLELMSHNIIKVKKNLKMEFCEDYVIFTLWLCKLNECI